jgi:uncharacterized protein with HEPN domain
MPMTDETTKRLRDVLGACRAIRSFTAGMDLAAYERNLLVRSGVERQLEIIGEAFNRASSTDEALVERVPVLRRVVGLRNRIIHGYDSVDDRIVWDVVQTKLPDLEREVMALLVATGDRPDDPMSDEEEGSLR